MSKIVSVLPLSPLQEGLLFHTIFDEGTEDPYCVQLVLELQGPLDAGALKAAVRGLMLRHPNLRAAFLHKGLDRPRQVVPQQVSLPWEFVDLSSLDEAQRRSGVDRLLKNDFARRFDPSRPPLLRFTAVALEAKRHLLVFTYHHLLLDGWSMPIVLQDLFALYDRRG